MVRIGICDDEKAVRERIASQMQALVPKDCLVLYASGEDVLAEQRQCDILFLDIQMPGTDGMTVAKKLRERNSRQILIFVTALKEYVYEAFDVKAFRYLVKPFSQKRLQEVLCAAVEECGHMPAVSGPKRKQLLVRSKGECIRVFLEDILYAEVYNRKVILHQREKTLEYYQRLSELESELGSGFVRVHRSYLVQLRCVERYNAKTIYLEDGSEIPIAKPKYAAFVKQYLDYIRHTDEGETDFDD